MSVKVVDLKKDGDAWIYAADRRLPKGRVRLRVGRDWALAEAVAKNIRERLARGDLSWMTQRRSAPVQLALRQAVKDYLDERVRFQTMELETRENYERELELHCYPTLGDRDVAQITKEDLKTMFEGVLGRKLSKAVCRNLLAPIRGTYEWLASERQLRIPNPAQGFGKLIGEKIDKKRRVKPLSQAHQVELLNAARGTRFYFLLVVALRCGLRLSECFGLYWTDFDLHRRILTVERQYRGRRLIDRTKKNKQRFVPLSTMVCEEFLVHRQRMVDETTRRKRELSPFIFTTRLGGPIRSKSSFIRKHLRPALAKAGIERHVTMRHLRQTFVDTIVGMGYLVNASEWAGHASVKVTGDYYSRAQQDPAIVDSIDAGFREADQKIRPLKLRRVR